jgi:hypothetical protein
VLKTINASVLLFAGLVISRLLPLPDNSEPLLGLAVLTPYLTKSNLAFLYPLGVMFVSDIFLGFHSSMLMTYSALAVAPFISRTLYNKYIALGCSWLVWHVLANIGLTYAPFTAESLLFDIKLLVSGLSVVVMYDLTRRLWQTVSIEA